MSGATDPAPGGSHWSDPEVEVVAPGVHRVPLPLPDDGLRAVNVYLLVEEGRLSLIDGGWATGASRAVLDAALERLGLGVADIDTILVTHVHRDHYTQAVTLRRDGGARVCLGAGERASLTALNDPDHRHHQVPLLLESGAQDLAAQWEAMFADQVRDLSVWEQPDTWLQAGPVVVGQHSLEAIETPGHTQGHLVFADLAAGLMFAGDHVLSTITPSIGFEPVSSALPLAAFLSSLAKLRALPDLRLLPAHGPVTDSVHARVEELLAHHAERLESCRDAVVGRAATAYEVARELPWTRRARAFTSLDAYNAGLAVLETRAHLEVLASQGSARRGTDATDGRGVTYEAVPA